MKQNRNNTSEAIRLPNEVVDFLKVMSEARKISRHELVCEIVSQYIVNEKKKYEGA